MIELVSGASFGAENKHNIKKHLMSNKQYSYRPILHVYFSKIGTVQEINKSCNLLQIYFANQKIAIIFRGQSSYKLSKKNIVGKKIDVLLELWNSQNGHTKMQRKEYSLMGVMRCILQAR